MSGSLRGFVFPRFNGVPLVSSGNQIPYLSISDRIFGRKFGFCYLIALIGMDFGIIWFWFTIKWFLRIDILCLMRYLQGLDSRIAVDPKLKSEGSKQDGFALSSIQSVDIFGDYYRCTTDSFLLLLRWGLLRVIAISLRFDLISSQRRSRVYCIWMIWKFRVFKGSCRAVNRYQFSLLLNFLCSSILLSFSFSGLCGISLLKLVSVALWITMSQSSLMGKGAVEKSLGAVVSKMRIKIPSFDNSALIKGYAKTMIGRCMNPRKQDIKGLLLMFPRICQVEGRVAGADLGLGRFQFDFDEEDDIVEVLKMEPFHFDGWMVSLVRWKPSVDTNYPSTLTFWIRVLGIPIEYWADPTFKSIGDALGKVVEVDLDGGRVKVIIDGFKPLCFETIIEFDSGETSVSLRYERLHGYCSYCFSLCHDVEHCEKKYGVRVPSSLPMTESDGAGAHNWSYKGAVVQDKQPKHGGDGKGKAIVSGKDRDEERIEPSNSKATGFGRGKQSRFVQGEGSSRYKRFTNYAQFNDHRFNEQKKLKAKATQATKVKVVDSTEAQAVQAEAIKPKKIVRKALVFEDEATGLSEQQMENKEPTVEEKQEVGDVLEAPTDQVSIQSDLEMGELNLELIGATTASDLGFDQSVEAVMTEGDPELEVEDDNVSDSAVLPCEDQVVSDSVEGDDTMGFNAEQGAEASKVNGKGKGREGPLAKKKLGRGLVLPGVTTRKRIVQALVSPRKRPAPKNGPKQGDDKFPPNQDPENGGPGGSQPSQPSA